MGTELVLVVTDVKDITDLRPSQTVLVITAPPSEISFFLIVLTIFPATLAAAVDSFTRFAQGSHFDSGFSGKNPNLRKFGVIKAINQAPIARYRASRSERFFPSLLAYLEFSSYPASAEVNKGSNCPFVDLDSRCGIRFFLTGSRQSFVVLI